MQATSPVRRTTTGGAHPLTPSGGTLWEAELLADPQVAAQGLQGLQQLAIQGKWREVVNRCRSFTATDTAAALAATAYHVLGLAKLRMVAEAAAELAKLGDLDDPQYAASKSHGSVSLVPFALRWLQAELPGLAGQPQDAVQPMYSLLGWCQQQWEEAEAGGGEPQSLVLWRERHRRVAFGLVGKHVRLRQYRSALSLLNQLLKEDADQPDVWSQAAHVQLSLGDVAAAQRSFERAAAAAAAASQEERAGGLGRWAGQLARDRALLLLAQQDHKGAAEQYSVALQLDPRDAVASNNRAVCAMYGGNLAGGIATLEVAFATAPDCMLQEVPVLNLASMYDLSATAASLEAKRRMGAWVAANAPDDLDLACTKSMG